MSLGFGLGFPKSAIAAGIQPVLNLQFAGSQVLDPRITFTRASSATYFDSAGVLQRATYNLLVRSEEFNNAIWVKTRSSITPDATSAPNNTLTADKLVEDTATGGHLTEQVVTGIADNTTVTASVFAKAAERQWVTIAVVGKDSSINRRWFNLLNGTAGATDGTLSASSITSVGNGWYRLTVTASVATGVSNPAVRINIGTADATPSYTGDGTSGIFIWGAQLEQASTAGPYWATTSAANGAPRFDYNPSTLAPLGLLIEEQRTNSIRNNTMVGAVAGTPGTLPTNWQTFTALTGLTREIVGTGTENGITYTDIRISGTPSAAGAYNIFQETITATAAASGQTWAFTHYSKLAAGSTTGISSLQSVIIEYSAASAFLTQGVTNFTPTTAAISTQRYGHTRTLTNASTAYTRSAIQINLDGSAIDITLRIGLPQLEQGAFATSVIPTTTAAATRAADNATMTGTNFSSWYNATEGTLYADVASANGNGARALTLSDGTINNQAWLREAGVSTNALEVYTSGSFVAQIGVVVAQPMKSAAAIKTNDFAVSVNGGSAATDTSGSVASYSQVNIGANYNASGSYLNGHIRRIAYFNTRLANANLQALTS